MCRADIYIKHLHHVGCSYTLHVHMMFADVCFRMHAVVDPNLSCGGWTDSSSTLLVCIIYSCVQLLRCCYDAYDMHTVCL